MRLMTLRYVGAIFYVVLLATTGLAHAQSSATSNVEANQLFIQAVMLYRHAIALPEEEASERLIQVRRLFDRILANHPDSLPGQAIRAGGSPGGVDLAALPPSLPTGWNDGKRAIARDLLNAYGGELAELERVADYADYAVLASAAYGGEDVIELARQRGWREHPRSLDGHFVMPRVWGVGDAAARLFISDRGEVVLSFRGTDTGADWLTNIGTVQPVFWDQLRSARVLADRALAIHPDVSFVGHSLGGAMAQMARLHTGQAAVIFNSAPLGFHALSMAISGELLNSQVRSALLAFRSPEDPLREVSESISGFKDAVVRNIALTDNTVFRNVLDGWFGTNHAHTMPVLAQAMQDARLARDEGWLYAYLLEQSGIGVFAEANNAVEGTTNHKPNGGWVFSYPLSETKELSILGREGCYIYAPYAKPTSVRWSGRCEGNRPVGEGRILWMENDRVDWLSDVGEEHGLVFRDGKLHVYADLSGSSVRYTCKNDENIFKNAVVHVPDGTKRELFRNHWLANAIAERIIEGLVTECPEVKPSWSTREPDKYGNALVKIRIPGIMEQYDKGIIEGRSQGKTSSWRNYENLAVKDVEKDVADENKRIRDEAARKKIAEQQLADAQRREADDRRRESQRLAVAAEKDRIEKLRLAAEEQWKERWRRQLEVEVPLENLTDLMRFDRATTISELAKGRHIILTYRSRNVEFAQGKAMLSDYQRGTDIYEGIPDGGFSWEGWSAAIAAAQKWSFTVVCRMDADALVGLSDGARYEVSAQLDSVADSDFIKQVVLDCARADQLLFR